MNIIIISTYTVTGTFVAESQKVLKAFLLPLKQYFTSLSGTPTTFTIFPYLVFALFPKAQKMTTQVLKAVKTALCLWFLMPLVI